MKIALFSDTFPPQVNGVANTVHRFALALGEMGHEVRVFTISGYKAEELEQYTEGKFTIHVFPSVPAFIYPGIRAGIPYTNLDAVKEFGPDIIHTHTPFGVGGNAVRSARRLKVPLVGTHHTFFDHYLKHVFLDYAWARMISWKLTVRYYNRCDLVISPTHSLATSLKEHGLGKPVEIIPNILDTDFFVPVPLNMPKPPYKTLVYMGRLSYEKSVDDALRAAMLVMQRLPTTRFIIIGDGPERKKLEGLATELGIAENTIFTGYLHGAELVQKLQEADVFLTGSKSENMPLALLEAMAVGLPLVAVRSLGLGEILHHEVNALLMAPDRPQELADSALELLQKDSMRQKFAHASRTMSLQYSKQAVMKRLAGAYQRLIEYATTLGATAGLKK